MSLRVVLVDDQALLRTGLRMILDETGDIEVVGEAGDGTAAVELVARTRPEVVLMDIRMPGLDGIEATRRIRATGHPPKVIILTTFDLDEYVLDGLRAGASGFLLKDTLAADLVSAVRAVASGEAVAAPSVTRRLIAHFLGTSRPQPRDTERLDALTPKTHIGHILAKLGLRDRVPAVILGYQCGLVS
jgi:DNA-binding NarL/FixJ family response regulator